MSHFDYEPIDATDREEGESLRDVVREAREEREAEGDDESSLAEEREELQREREELEEEAEETRVVRDDDTTDLADEREQLEREREELEEEAEDTQLVRDDRDDDDDDGGSTAPPSEPTDDPSRDQPPDEMMNQMASDMDDDDDDGDADVEAAQDRAFIRRVEREDPLAARFTPPEEFPSEAAAPLAQQFTPPSEVPSEAFGPLPTRVTPPSELDESFPGFEPEFIQPREIEPRDEPDRVLLEFESSFREGVTEPLDESIEEGLEEQERVGLAGFPGFLGGSPTAREAARSTPDVIQGAVEAPRAIRELRFESQRRRREAALDALAEPVDTGPQQAVDVIAPGERILAEGSIEAGQGFRTFVEEEGVERGAGRAAAFTVGAFGIGAGLTSGARSVSRAIRRDMRGVDRATAQLPRTGRRRGRGDGDRVEITAADIDPRMLSRSRGRTPAQVRERRGRSRSLRERESFEQRRSGEEGGPVGRRESVEAPEVEATQRQQLVAEQQIEMLRARGDPIPSRLQEFLGDPVTPTTRPVTGPRTGTQTEREAIGRIEEAERIEVLEGPAQLEATETGLAEPVDQAVRTGPGTAELMEEAQQPTIATATSQEPELEADPVQVLDEEADLDVGGDVDAATMPDSDVGQRTLTGPRQDLGQREDLAPIAITEPIPDRILEPGDPIPTGRPPPGRLQRPPPFRNRRIPPRIPPIDIEPEDNLDEPMPTRRRRLFLREFEAPVSPDPFEDIEASVGQIDADIDLSGLD